MGRGRACVFVYWPASVPVDVCCWGLVVHNLHVPAGEVDTVHVCGMYIFVSYTAVLDGVSSVPVGMIRVIDLSRATPPTDLKARGDAVHVTGSIVCLYVCVFVCLGLKRGERGACFAFCRRCGSGCEA